MTASILADRRRVAPHGLAGGSPGECGQTWVERADRRREVLASCAQVEVQAGDAVVISTPSGGGYGAPA
jgi:5-oxoprolinase (ATP-hydrolysing)